MDKKGFITLAFVIFGIGFLSSMLTSEAVKPYTTSVGECNDGCVVSEKCIGIGQRFMINESVYYCNEEKNVSLQKEIGEICQQDYECKSLLCGNNLCITIEEKQEENSNTFLGKLWAKLKIILFSLRPTI